MSVPPPIPPTPLPYAQPGLTPASVPCPRCGGPANPVVFTWWGGLVGPKMFSHTKCSRCGFAFNRKTGRSNNTAIAIYVGVAVTIALIGVTLWIVFQYIN